MSDLITAARKQVEYAQNELKSGDKAKALEHLSKAAGFLVRAEAAPAPVPTNGATAAEPLSADRNVAIHQVLAATGHPTVLDDSGASIGSDPLAVKADATPEQIEALTVLGYFGSPGTVAGIDYAPYEAYYEQTSDDGQGNTGWAPKPGYDNGDAVWAAWLASKA